MASLVTAAVVLHDVLDVAGEFPAVEWPVSSATHSSKQWSPYISHMLCNVTHEHPPPLPQVLKHMQ